eukprot:TRINITY_DN1672_c0_g1_i1.p1 TRINITY_DN1672_c0_g1~~TRINITY_DN1672_c0_g1_i1.p1  ORF type:complete len:323 (-),score=47.82 TRINITY_DN1672_c0_g1_i1:373-1341(-)
MLPPVAIASLLFLFCNGAANDDLLAWLTFEEVTLPSGILHDETEKSTCAISGTLACATVVGGQVGSALRMQNKHNAMCYVTCHGNFNSSAISVAVWVKLHKDNLQDSQIVPLFSSEPVTITFACGNEACSPRLQISGTPANTTAFYNANNQITDDKWHHIAATWYTNGAALVFLDGRVVSVIPAAANSANITLETWYIGRPASSLSATLDASIDDLRIYNRALPTSEIKILASVDNSTTRLWFVYIGFLIVVVAIGGIGLRILRSSRASRRGPRSLVHRYRRSGALTRGVHMPAELGDIVDPQAELSAISVPLMTEASPQPE